MNRYLFFMILVAAYIGTPVAYGQQKFEGSFSNGYKGAKFSFVVSADKKAIRDVTFTGYWRCSGSTESITTGPKKSLPVVNGELHAIITDPENGGASAFRFDINGTINATSASGTFRMSITGLSCDTYLLKWTAKPI